MKVKHDKDGKPVAKLLLDVKLELFQEYDYRLVRRPKFILKQGKYSICSLTFWNYFPHVENAKHVAVRIYDSINLPSSEHVTPKCFCIQTVDYYKSTIMVQRFSLTGGAIDNNRLVTFRYYMMRLIRRKLLPKHIWERYVYVCVEARKPKL